MCLAKIGVRHVEFKIRFIEVIDAILCGIRSKKEMSTFVSCNVSLTADEKREEVHI